jgi:hypothetical protein
MNPAICPENCISLKGNKSIFHTSRIIKTPLGC